MSFHCAGPKCQHHLLKADLTISRPQEGIRPRYSGLRVQGTATSPLSTITFTLTKKIKIVNVIQGDKNTIHRHMNELISPNLIITKLYMAEARGFEPPQRVNALTDFESVPFSRTWVRLQINDILNDTIFLTIIQ